MNIAIIGCPGSGKTELAEELQKKLGGVIVDGYAPYIEDHTQLALGTFGTYIGNLYVALERYAEERKARMKHEFVFSCGTLIETAVYVAMNFTAIMNIAKEDDLQIIRPQLDAILRMMAVLYEEVFDYDHGFYLPPRDASEDNAHMDQQIQAALGSFKLVPVTTLLDEETRVADALAKIEELQNAPEDDASSD